MIPFKLFKYIYFTEILYTIIYGIFGAIILGILIFLNVLINKSGLNIPILVLSTACIVFVILYISKFVLNEVIFCKYKKIKIVTDFKTISWKFFLKIFVPRTLATVLIDLIFDGISHIVFKYGKSHFGLIYLDSIISIKNIIDFICFIVQVIVDYNIYNWYLSKYISVSWQSKSENNELV